MYWVASGQAYPGAGYGQIPYGYPYGGPFSPVMPSTGGATAAMVLGIVAIVLVWIPFLIGAVLGWMLGIPAIILGGRAMSRFPRGTRGRSRGVAGLTLGIVTVSLTFVGVGTFI